MKVTHSSHREQGAALVTSLIFLTVLTILGMSTLGTSLLESRMAGNMRDRNYAFQAAEMGLRDAELFIRDSGRITGNVFEEMGSDPGFYGAGCSYGLCYNGPTWAANGTSWVATPVWTVEANWGNAIQYQRDVPTTTGKAIGRTAGGTQVVFDSDCLDGRCYTLPAAPLPLVFRQPEYLIETFSLKPGNDKYYYRITVRGYGMLRGTRVLLQEIYTR